MIRIYLDWNIITELKKEDGGKYVSLKKKLKKYEEALLIPFSNYHIEDLIKNNKTPDKIERYVKVDLEFLEKLSNCHFLGVDKNGRILPQIGSPLNFLDNIEPDNLEELLDFEKLIDSLNNMEIGENKIEIGNLIKSLYELQPIPNYLNNTDNSDFVKKLFPNINEAQNMWDLIKGFSNFNKKLFLDKGFLKDFRNDIQQLSLHPDVNRGNLKSDVVIENLNKGFSEKSVHFSFQELLKSSLESQKNVSQSSYFTTAYLLLDFYGYKSDKLSKPSNSFLNITNDANHSYIGAHCDFLVSDDERFLAKSKVLYNEFNIKTEILTAEDFDIKLDKIVHYPIGNIQSVLNLVAKFINPDYLVMEDNDPDVSSIFKLPIYFFNYFNYLIQDKSEKDLIILIFRRLFKNYSDFVYFTDTSQLLKDLFNCLGENNDQKNYPDVENDFVYSNESNKERNIIWSFGNIHFILEKEIEFNRESLKILIDNTPY